jgi:hypothetical protein
MSTVLTATTVPIGSGAGSLHVSAMSPARAAGFPLIITVALPLMIVALLVGGLTNVPPIGMCGGRLVAVLPSVAAGIPLMNTFELTPPSIMPMNGCGTGTGGVGPGGWIRWMSDAVTLSPSFAAGCPMRAAYSAGENRLHANAAGPSPDREPRHEIFSRGKYEMPSVDRLLNAYCVRKDGTVGIWQSDYSSFAAVTPSSQKLASIAFDDKGVLWGVNADGNVVRWQNAASKTGPDGETWAAGSWATLEALGKVRMLTFHGAPGASAMYAVNENGDIIQWTGFQWTDPQSDQLYVQKNDPKKLSMIAWDTATPPNLWAISDDNDVLKWDPAYNQWEDYKNLGSKLLKMLAFDATGVMWGVTAADKSGDSQIVRWDSGTAAAGGGPASLADWKQDDYFKNAAVSWLAFKPAAAPAK